MFSVMNLSLLTDRLEKFTGATVTLARDDKGLTITFDTGPRRACVGGWAGGTTTLYLPSGMLVPQEISGGGRDPLDHHYGAWYDMLSGTGYFD